MTVKALVGEKLVEGSRGLYVSNDLEMKLETLKEWTEEREEGARILIGGFQCKIRKRGRRGKRRNGERNCRKKQKVHKVRKVNGKGKLLCRWLEEKGWSILNF